MNHKLIVKTMFRGKVVGVFESKVNAVSFKCEIPCHYVSESVNEHIAVLLLLHDRVEILQHRNKNGVEFIDICDVTNISEGVQI